VYIYADFVDELSLVVKVAFLKFQILPQKPKPQKQKSKKKSKKKTGKTKKKQQDKKPQKKVSPFEYFKQKGLSGIINIIKRVATFVVGAFRDLFKRITVTDFSLDFKIAGEDSSDSAIKYGQCCAVVFPALRLIFDVVKCENYNVNINPDFSDEPKTSVNVKVVAKIRLCSIITFVFSKAFSALRIYLKAKPKTKPRK
jgi:hypothetical protein